MNPRAKVLVAEKIGDPGVELLREHFDVDVGVDWSEQELLERFRNAVLSMRRQAELGLHDRQGQGNPRPCDR